MAQQTRSPTLANALIGWTNRTVLRRSRSSPSSCRIGQAIDVISGLVDSAPDSRMWANPGQHPARLTRVFTV